MNLRVFTKIGSWLVILFGIGLVVYGVGVYISPQITIEWKTANELNTLGFYILRGQEAGDTLIRLNEAPIMPTGSPLDGGSYEFVDTDVEIGRIYIYYIEDVDASGNQTIHGPIQTEANRGGKIEMVTGISLVTIILVGNWLILRNKKK